MTTLNISNDTTMMKAEFDVQISTAKAYPRNQNKFIEEAIKLVTTNEKTAESCIYSVPRANTKITGKSIRLAEIIAHCYGNIHAATRIIDNDGSFITVEAVCWDLEKNVRMSAPCRRSIKDKSGKTYSADMQVVTTNAAASIALRNAIFKVVPPAIVDQVYEAAVKCAVEGVKPAAGKPMKTPEDRKQEIFSRFNIMGIPNEVIFKFFDKNSIAEFNKDDLEVMIGVGTAIKEGSLKISEAFNLDCENTEENSANQRLNKVLSS